MREARHDADMERAVIGAVMLDQRAMEDITLKGEDFYSPQHEELWDLILTEYRARRPVSALAIAQKLISAPIVGVEPTYLHECMAAAPTRSEALHHAGILTGLARLRRLADVGAKLQQMSAMAEWNETEQVLDDARSVLDSTANEATGIRVTTYADALQEAIELWSSPKGESYPTGWSDLDRKLNGGWHPGQLTIMGARPAVGKSLVAGCAAVAASSYGTGFFSLEMKKHEVVARMTAATEGVDLHHLNSQQLTEADWSKVARHTQRTAEWPVYIEEASRITMAQVRATVRTWKRRGPVPLVILDYLQLVAPADRSESRERQVSRIAEDCKHLAKEFDTHVLALAQVNRGSTQRADTRPTMADLRESGGIEAHADNIILLHRDDEEMEGEIEFIIEKNRHGETGRIRLAWRPHFASVNSMSMEPGDYRYGIA